MTDGNYNGDPRRASLREQNTDLKNLTESARYGIILTGSVV